MANSWGRNGNSDNPFPKITLGQRRLLLVEQPVSSDWLILFWGAPKSLQTVTVAMKLRLLLLGRKPMTNLDSIFKSRDFTLPTKVSLVKAMVYSISHV